MPLQIVAALLLLMQSVVGIAGGRVVCIPRGGCADHAPPAARASCPCDAHKDAVHPCDADAVSRGGGSGGQALPACAEREGCGCHLHVAMPEDLITGSAREAAWSPPASGDLPMALPPSAGVAAWALGGPVEGACSLRSVPSGGGARAVRLARLII
ncbi:MAG: hypothetical protein JNK35_10320 [Phycisphaerae bacterium]|nr:hypothetical protein [Phycisphaerae bacterium]